MITVELTKKINMLPQDSYNKVEKFVEQLLVLNTQAQRERAFKIFMEKMSVAERSVQEQGYFTEEEVEAELAKI